MDEELREKVANILSALAPEFREVCVEEILAAIAFVLVREQREAFCAGYRATCHDCAEAEAERRYPGA